MNSVDKIRSISVWIFIIPFISVNTCILLIVTHFHQILEPGVQRAEYFPTFPYLDGECFKLAELLEIIPCILYFNPQCL